jgi:hypothetical protein
MDKITAIVMVRKNYGIHPLGTKFCKCGWILCPPAYPGDYWDCTNNQCNKSIAPTNNQIKKMWVGNKKRT